VRIDLDHLRAQVPIQRVINAAHGFDGIPAVNWYDSLPGPGMVINLMGVPCGAVPDRWFSPVLSADSRPPLRFRLTERGILATARLAGVRLPKAESANLDAPEVLARWVAQALREHGRCRIIAMVSRALRIALAAEEMGLDLSGATFSVGGEPLTEAKARVITRTGARLVSAYYFAEAGAIGYSCGHPRDHGDLHLLVDHLALIQHPREVPGFDASVDSFHFTTLLPMAPKVLLNAESDDYGIVEDRACGCLFGDLGMTTHLRDIRSFQKLTGEGVTLIGSDMVRILEEVLPSRFGGSPLDYQLLEEEDGEGFTRLSLIISPRVDLPDEDLVIDAVLEELGNGDAAADISRAVWDQAGTLRVRRTEPLLTARGKLLPLHMVTRGGASGSRSSGG
jgi:hypothetical protein